jgi:hypothetical protein
MLRRQQMMVTHSIDSDCKNLFQSHRYTYSGDLAEFLALEMKLFLTVSPRTMQKPDQSQFVGRILEESCDGHSTHPI